MFKKELFKIRLKEERKKKKMTQEALGNRADIVPDTISKYERGESTPSIETMAIFAEIFGVSIDYLAGRESPKKETIDYKMELLKKASKLTDEEKKALYTIANLLVSKK